MLGAGSLYSPVKWSWSQIFLSPDLNGLVQIKQLVALLYFLHYSWVSHFIGILLARCCLLCHALSCRQLLKAWFFVPSVTYIFPNGFSIPLHWYSHANNIDRDIFCCCHYYIASIPVCSILSPIHNEMFFQQ